MEELRCPICADCRSPNARRQPANASREHQSPKALHTRPVCTILCRSHAAMGVSGTGQPESAADNSSVVQPADGCPQVNNGYARRSRATGAQRFCSPGQPAEAGVIARSSVFWAGCQLPQVMADLSAQLCSNVDRPKEIDVLQVCQDIRLRLGLCAARVGLYQRCLAGRPSSWLRPPLGQSRKATTLLVRCSHLRAARRLRQTMPRQACRNGVVRPNVQVGGGLSGTSCVKRFLDPR